MKKPVIKARKWNGTSHGLCPSCRFLEDCMFPRSNKHLPYIVTVCNEHIMDLRMDAPDIVLLDGGEIYVR